MIEYLKSTQVNSYVKVTRMKDGFYMVDLSEGWVEPIDGIVVGTFTMYHSGYNYLTGETYDEVFVDFYSDVH